MSAPPIPARWHVADMTREVVWRDPEEREDLHLMELPEGSAWIVLSVPSESIPQLLSGAEVSIAGASERGRGF